MSRSPLYRDFDPSQRVLLGRVDEQRPPLLRQYDEIQIGVDYYGIVLPPEVEAYIRRIWAQVDALESALWAFFGKKYGLIKPPGGPGQPPTYKDTNWAEDDLKLAQSFDSWANGFKTFGRYYIEGDCGGKTGVSRSACMTSHAAWQWIASNSLAAYKECEAYEKQSTDWKNLLNKKGVEVTSADAHSAVTKLDIGGGIMSLAELAKWVVIGGVAYVGYKVAGNVRMTSKSKSDEIHDRAQTDAHETVKGT